MNDSSKNTFVGFNDFFQALSSKKIVRTKDGNLNISGNTISLKDFDKFYMHDITSILSDLETTISPEFLPGKELYSTLDILSSPVLKETKVPEALKKFYKKLNLALSSKSENRKTFENGVRDYIDNSEEKPAFMIASLDREIENSDESSFRFNSLMPTSSEIMDGYGTSYNGEDILDLANMGYVDSKSPLTMLICRSLYVQDENSEDYVQPVSYEQLLEFYSPEKNPGRMHSILANDGFDPTFSELHSELLENVSSKERKEYIKDLVDEAKSLASTPSDYSNDLLSYTNYKILPDTILSGNITPEFLKSKFIIGEITIARILKIYESDTKYFEPLKSILTPSEIEKAHSKEEISDQSLMYLPANNRLAYLQKKDIKLSTIMYLFLHCDGMSINDLIKIISANHKLESLDFYIDEGSNPSRVKELYENFLIDYGCIKSLISSGILKESDFNRFKLSVSKDDLYTKIQDSSSIKINDNTDSLPFTTTGAFIGKQSLEQDTLKKSYELFKILGNISEESSLNTPVISHKVEKQPGLLDGYRVVPLRPANLVAFVPKEFTQSTYLMPYQETAYILHNKKMPDSFLDNPAFQEIKFSENQHEDILNATYHFEESKNYLDKLGFREDLDYDEAIKIMTQEYIKIRTKGEN